MTSARTILELNPRCPLSASHATRLRPCSAGGCPLRLPSRALCHTTRSGAPARPRAAGQGNLPGLDPLGRNPFPHARSVATTGGQRIAPRARLPDALRSGRFHSMGSRGDSGYRADPQVSGLWDLDFAPLSCCAVRPLTGRPSADARSAAGCQALRRLPPGARTDARDSVARPFRPPGRYALLPRPHPPSPQS